MPTSTKCFCILGFAGLLASAGCTSTTAVNQTASLAPTPASAENTGLPESMEVASVDRDAAAGNASEAGSVITAVAYAAPAPQSGSLAAVNAAVASSSETTTLASAAESSSADNQHENVAEAGAVAAQPLVQTASLEPRSSGKVEARSPELDQLIARYAAAYEVPVALVRRVVKRESTFNPEARNGPYWGLMQIRHDTAKGMGYAGSASGLLNAETNLTYAVKYLRGAYITAKGDHDQAVKYYSRGYYYDAKKRGLLEATGLRGDKVKTAKPIIAAVENSAVAKAADLKGDRGARVASSQLPGVTSQRFAAPSSARMGGSPAATGAEPVLSMTD